MAKKAENKLKKLGVPAAYVSITATIVTLLCHNLGV